MTIDILALARECGVVLDQEWGDEYIATCSVPGLKRFVNAIIERCAVRLEAAADDREVNNDRESGIQSGICYAATIVRSMKAPTP